ncbi:MAG: recombination mediator RecR [Bacteroidota bacterium]|nr:recombination mediator RecR [Bacteroidota bacterium]|tara:strand:+ start:17839 stop:18444 length:606 start_codon:yes stop_codon:yes gene_type:complete
MNFPSKIVENAVNHLSSLPGVGKKTALRLVLHLLKRDKLQVEKFGESFLELVNKIKYCDKCYAISDTDICGICNNSKRDNFTICIVEDIRVMMAIENTSQYNGIYHILGGLISPLDGIGPNDIKISELIQRIENEKIQEVIFALSTTMEGDTTNYYLFKVLEKYNVKISSIARGIAIGDDIEYADEITLGAAISSRIPYIQ